MPNLKPRGFDEIPYESDLIAEIQAGFDFTHRDIPTEQKLWMLKQWEKTTDIHVIDLIRYKIARQKTELLTKLATIIVKFLIKQLIGRIPMFDKIISFLDGKKSYIIAVLTGVAAALQSLGIEIPSFVWPILGALGLGAVRAGIKKSGD